MGDENPIRTLGDCSKLSHDGYRNIIKLPVGNNVPEESQVNEPDAGQEEKGNLGNIYSNSHSQPDLLASIVIEQIIRDDDEPQNRSLNEGKGATTEGSAIECFDTFTTRDKLTYHKYLMSGPIPLIFLRNPIIMKRCPSNLKITCNIGRKLNPRENANRGISNFTGRVKGMHVFVGNFTYVVDFMIVEDISSIIDHRLSRVVLGRHFIKVSNMTHDLPEGVVRNEEDKRKGVDYVVSKILGFYKECLELGPEHVTGLDDEGEVT
uniref:Protein kinase-like domain, concanavalin A-like lectin/glucanase domain protein n=1 Tax=Tanacetum cinerariifolium TaxID=118510 RepID=A0A6L2NE14_TANCI|nr:protein kinase-like domain, concanavalin A-like lectin/glucanase domain protein [Tanacetum cinerariifolium]